MPLKLTLKPNEKIFVNGAVIQNGPDRTEIILQNKVPLLRQKDIMSEEADTTPARRIYFLVQLAYISPEQREERVALATAALEEFLAACPSAGALIAEISGLLVDGRAYDALRSCRALVDHELGFMTDERKVG